MDADIDNTLRSIHDEMASAGEQVQQPAAPDELDALRRYAEDHLGTKLPAGYIDFLSKTDGLDFNGTTVYAAKQRPLPSGGTMLGFREANDTFRQGGDRQQILFGETGDELFLYSIREQSWCVADRGSLSILDRFDTFDALLDHVLRRAYAT
jgi:hypothetical protein